MQKNPNERLKAVVCITLLCLGVALVIIGLVVGPRILAPLGISIPGCAMVLRLIYTSKDTRMIKHSPIIYRNEGDKQLVVEYSRCVPFNDNLEMYVDDQHVCSIYRDNTVSVNVPANSEKVRFYRRGEEAVGEFDLVDDPTPRFYYHAVYTKPREFPREYEVRRLEADDVINTSMEEEAYGLICQEIRFGDLTDAVEISIFLVVATIMLYLF